MLKYMLCIMFLLGCEDISPTEAKDTCKEWCSDQGDDYTIHKGVGGNWYCHCADGSHYSFGGI